MKFTIFASSFVACAANSLPFYKTASKVNTPSDIKTNSRLGKNLIAKARRLDEAAEVDYSWIADFSIKFQGCFHMSQWNADAEDEEDVRIMTKRLVRFRLCDSSECSSSAVGGCSSGYGDYIVDMDDFVQVYYENKRETQEQACEAAGENCGCDNDDGRDDGFDEEECENDCYKNAGMSYCIRDEDALEVEDYLVCAQWDVPEGDDDGGRRRRLEDAEEEVAYYVGPYCADQGGSIFMGMFSDDTCTQAYDDSSGADTYLELSGSSLPYSGKTLVGSGCTSCYQEPDGDDVDDGYDYVKEACLELYQASGKCETELDIDDPNENACTYMEGVKITRKNGSIIYSQTGSSNAANAFIAIFAVSFFSLGAYVYYLQTKISGAKINLADA